MKKIFAMLCMTKQFRTARRSSHYIGKPAKLDSKAVVRYNLGWQWKSEKHHIGLILRSMADCSRRAGNNNIASNSADKVFKNPHNLKSQASLGVYCRTTDIPTYVFMHMSLLSTGSSMGKNPAHQLMYMIRF